MNRLRAWFLAPTWTANIILFLGPLAIILGYSFLTRGVYGGMTPPWTAESYQRLIDPIYLAILWRSFWVAGASTALCLLLGFPLALFISRAGRLKNFYLGLVMLPFWTSFLVRTYAWMFLLRDTGLINTVLQKLGLIQNPLPLLYNDGAVILGLVYGYLPFIVLPLYATLERLDRSLLEAAADLGAKPWAALTRDHDSAVRARNPRGRDSGVHSVPGRVSDARSAGRRKIRDDRQPDSKPIHHGARLAVRLGGVAGVDGDRDGAAVCDRARAKARIFYEAARRRTSDLCHWRLSVSASAAADPLDLQLQFVAVHGLGGIFAALVFGGVARHATDRVGAEQPDHRGGRDHGLHRSWHAVRVWPVETQLAAAGRFALFIAGDARKLSPAFRCWLSISGSFDFCGCSWECTR